MFEDLGRFIRRKTFYCDRGKNDIELELFPMRDFPKARTRHRKVRETSPVQKVLNSRRARRYFRRLVKGNFGRGDFSVTLTYKKEFLPTSADEGVRVVQGYLRRLRNVAKKHNNNFRYILVTEEMRNGNIHHHLLMNGDAGVSRDEAEKLWHTPQRRGQRQESLGLVNCRRIQVDRETGIEGLANYLAKDPKGRRRWLGSRNLWRPQVSVADRAVSKRDFTEICLFDDESGRAYEFFEKEYQGYKCLSFRKEFNAENNCWYVRVVLHRKGAEDAEQGCVAGGYAEVWPTASD